MNKSKTRILFTIPNFITAGSGQAMWNVVSRLNPDIFDPAICVLKRGGALEAEIEAAGVPILELPFTVPARPLHRLPAAVVRAARHFRQYKFDIWHSYHYLDDYSEPLIARASGARAWIYTKKSMSWGGRGWKIRSLLATRIAAMNSAMLTTFFSGQAFHEKTRFIPPSVDSRLFQPTTPARLNIRARLGIPDNTLVAGCVAHLLPVKGQKYLIQALARVSNIHLLLAGRTDDQEYTKELRELSYQHDIVNRVHFLGNMPDVPALHAELDVFVLPSLARGRMEGCPVALLEAMSSGLPCIASRIPGVEDVIRDGVSGLLTVPEGVDSLASALQTLSTNESLRRQLGKAARERILQNYTVDREVGQYEELYLALSTARSRHQPERVAE